MTNSRFNQWKFPFLTALLLFGLVFSKWLLSVAQFAFLLTVLSDSVARKKLISSFANPLVISLVAIFLYHIMGLLWTEDIRYGLKDLQIKLPLLTLPILFYAAGPYRQKTTESLWLLFISFVVALSIASFIRIQINPHAPGPVAIGQSHIRFSLMICLAVFILIHYAITTKARLWLFSLGSIPVLIAFMIMLGSFTGFMVMLFMVFLVPFLYWKYIQPKWVRFAVISVLMIISFLAGAGLIDVKTRFFPTIQLPDISNLDLKSSDGEDYHHDFSTLLAENGHPIFIYIAEKEMVAAWNSRSDKQLNENDHTYRNRLNIIIRYLSSKGLRKDREGINSLSQSDIRNIENGYTNYLQPELDPFRERLYRFFWEWSVYNEIGDPSGHSLTQRFEYWKAAVLIIQGHYLFGVGTGDISGAFSEQYSQMNTMLEPPFRLRSHNQFLSITVQLGITGLLIFFWSILFPFLRGNIPDRKLYIGFIFIFLLSLINEDTLETQTGATFYALFNSFLLFLIPQVTNRLHHEKT